MGPNSMIHRSALDFGDLVATAVQLDNGVITILELSHLAAKEVVSLSERQGHSPEKDPPTHC